MLALHPAAPTAPLTLLFSHSLRFLLCLSLQHFLPLLKYAFTEVPPPLLLGSAMFYSGSVLRLAGMGCVQHRVASKLFSQRSPAPCPATKTVPPTPSTATQHLHYFLCGCVLCCCFHPWVCLILFLSSSEESVTIERKPGCPYLVQYK